MQQNSHLEFWSGHRLATFLRRIVFIGEAPFRELFDFELAPSVPLTWKIRDDAYQSVESQIEIINPKKY